MTSFSFFIDRFDLLSDEVVLHILQWIPTRNLKSIALVCKRFYQLCQDASLWTRMDASSSALAQGALGRILSRQILLLKLAQAKVRLLCWVFVFVVIFVFGFPDSVSYFYVGCKSKFTGFSGAFNVFRSQYGVNFTVMFDWVVDEVL